MLFVSFMQSVNGVQFLNTFLLLLFASAPWTAVFVHHCNYMSFKFNLTTTTAVCSTWVMNFDLIFCSKFRWLIQCNLKKNFFFDIPLLSRIIIIFCLCSGDITLSIFCFIWNCLWTFIIPKRSCSFPSVVLFPTHNLKGHTLVQNLLQYL